MRSSILLGALAFTSGISAQTGIFNSTAMSPTGTVSVLYSTMIVTLTSCAATVTDCPARLSTSLVPISTVGVGAAATAGAAAAGTGVMSISPSQFTGAAGKIGGSIAGLVLGGAALLL